MKGNERGPSNRCGSIFFAAGTMLDLSYRILAAVSIFSSHLCHNMCALRRKHAAHGPTLTLLSPVSAMVAFLSRFEDNNHAACDYDGGDCEWILRGYIVGSCVARSLA